MMIVSWSLFEPDEQSKECKTVNIITITITITIVILITIITTSVGNTHRAEAPIIGPPKLS